MLLNAFAPAFCEARPVWFLFNDAPVTQMSLVGSPSDRRS